jgi:hypothetical protein
VLDSRIEWKLIGDHRQTNHHRESPRRESHRHIDRIEHVSAYHADFVDDEQVHFPKDVQFLASQAQALTQQSGTVGRDIRIYDVIARNEAGQGQTEHRVNGDATGIDRGNASGSYDHDVLRCPLHKSLQQCRLAGTGFSRDETVFARVQGKLFGELEFSIVHFGKSSFSLGIEGDRVSFVVFCLLDRHARNHWKSRLSPPILTWNVVFGTIFRSYQPSWSLRTYCGECGRLSGASGSPSR